MRQGAKSDISIWLEPDITTPLSQNSCRFPKLRMIRIETTHHESKDLPCRIQRTGLEQSA